MRPTNVALAVAVFTAAASPAPRAEADPTGTDRPYLDIPITQTVNRDGVIRYAVWVKVGDRSVQAMLDTGSTGLRVLPSVFHDDVAGLPTDVAFGAGLHMEGLAIRASIEIGSLKGVVPVEVVTHISCVAERPDCDVTNLGSDAYLIGGDGYPSEGYSAILGIGFPFRGTDIENPLAALGAKRWIVDLPRPYEAADGHLILDPDAPTARAFHRLARNGIADADGCIKGGPLTEAKCGTVLFDTGAPAINVSYEGLETASRWEDGAAGTLTFKLDPNGADSSAADPGAADAGAEGPKPLTLDFQAGNSGGLLGVGMTPPEKHDPPEPFILAGVTPYFTYDMLYDQAAHAVALKARTPVPAFAESGTAMAPLTFADDGLAPPARGTATNGTRPRPGD